VTELTLKREYADADGTFGRLILSPNRWWYTAEDDWLDNAKGKSCIPLGVYPLVRTTYEKKKAKQDLWWKQFDYQTFEIDEVPERDRILIHPGNTEEDVEGCVLIGKSMGYVTVVKDEDTGLLKVRKRAVLQSKEAFREFMAEMAGIDRATLRVVGVVG